MLCLVSFIDMGDSLASHGNVIMVDSFTEITVEQFHFFGRAIPWLFEGNNKIPVELSFAIITHTGIGRKFRNNAQIQLFSGAAHNGITPLDLSMQAQYLVVGGNNLLQALIGES